MKLSFSQFINRPLQTLAPIYVISGEEPLLIQDAVDFITESAFKEGFSERNRIQTEGNDWINVFYSELQTRSLFSTKRVFELNLTQTKITSAITKLLQEYAQNVYNDNLLIIRMNKLDAKSEQTAWYKSVDKVGIFIPVWPITLDQLPNWIIQRARKMKLNLSLNSAERLSIQVEGNLLAATQELEKLQLLQEPGVLDKVIEDTATDNAQYDVFSLVDSFVSGNIKRSVQILRHLRAENFEPTLLLWAITRELRTLSLLAKSKQEGKNLAALFPKFRIFEKRQPIVRNFLQKYPYEACLAFLAKAVQMDRLIKGAEKGNIWVSVERLFLEMG